MASYVEQEIAPLHAMDNHVKYFLKFHKVPITTTTNKESRRSRTMKETSHQQVFSSVTWDRNLQNILQKGVTLWSSQVSLCGLSLILVTEEAWWYLDETTATSLQWEVVKVIQTAKKHLSRWTAESFTCSHSRHIYLYWYYQLIKWKPLWPWIERTLAPN